MYVYIYMYIYILFVTDAMTEEYICIPKSTDIYIYIYIYI